MYCYCVNTISANLCANVSKRLKTAGNFFHLPAQHRAGSFNNSLVFPKQCLLFPKLSLVFPNQYLLFPKQCLMFSKLSLMFRKQTPSFKKPRHGFHGKKGQIFDNGYRGYYREICGIYPIFGFFKKNCFFLSLVLNNFWHIVNTA